MPAMAHDVNPMWLPLEHSLAFHATHALLVVLGSFAVLRTSDQGRPLWYVTLASCGVVALFLLWGSDPKVFFEDFRKAYWPAGRAALAGPDAFENIYDAGVQGFVNLPIVAYIFAPFAILPERAAGVAFTVLGAGATLYVWLALTQALKFDRKQAALALFAFAAFGPLVHSIKQGNTSHILLAMVVWASLRSQARPALSGVSLGLAALIKPPLLLLSFYFLARGHWRVALSSFAVIASATALSLLIFGWELHRAWYVECIAPHAEGAIGAFNAQSIAAAIVRLEHGIGVLWNWDVQPLSTPGATLVSLLSMSLLALTAWMFLRHRAATLAEVSICLALICVIGKVTWSHYYVWLLPAFAVIWAQMLALAPRRSSVVLGLPALFALTAPAEFLSQPMAAGLYPGAALLSSYLTLAGLLTFAWLLTLHARRFELRSGTVLA